MIEIWILRLLWVTARERVYQGDCNPALHRQCFTAAYAIATYLNAHGQEVFGRPS